MPAEQALTVLVAEDSAVDRLLLAQIVRRQGHQVFTAENGEQAVALYLERRPQLVLLDALMPVMDGFEATCRLRAGDAGQAAAVLPIIAMTANAMQGDREQCLKVGMNDYLAKPVGRDDLVAVLARWTAEGAAIR